MDKLVVFDWGGVIERFGKGTYTVRDAYILLLEQMGYDFNDKSINESIMKFVYDLRDTFTFNDQEMECWYESIKHRYDSCISYDKFTHYYKKYFEYTDTNIDTINLIYETRKKHRIALLSNLNILDVDRLEKQVNLDKFDYLFLSCDIKMKKPNDNIYEYVEKTTNYKPKDIIYIDDSKTNTGVAFERGWNTICENGINTENIKKKILEFTK